MRTILLMEFLLVIFSLHGFAQEVKIPGLCKPQLDTAMVQETTMEEAIKWSESKPLKVGCDDGKVYILHRFNISIFTKKPLQTIEYGTGEEGGIPILAQNAIKKAKAGDTVILKNAVYTDSSKAEQKLPVISFQLK
ncbi:MAG TPA: hypothetical protein VJY62_08490 [Bacteroidia bacterium]|nr:hypothetical protein [Bacteroidia bacterium]